MEKMKRAIFAALHMSICNFRCDYCYLAQKESAYEGRQIDWKITSDFIKKAYSQERLGGPCYFNMCADGETLLVNDLELYVKALLEIGHFVEIVTNMSIKNRLDDFLSILDEDCLTRLSFKCSLHYLELQKKNLLKTFADNVNHAWDKGCSATVEMVGSDEYLPYVEDIKKYCLDNFGALPHVTIARDDRNERDYLTKLPLSEYLKVWKTFDSDFFEFKQSIFNVKRKEFCYAGMWSLHVDFETGAAKQCYCPNFTQNIYENVERPVKWIPICKCRDYHCYNGHALLTVGLIPTLNTPYYGTNMRNRYNTIRKQNWYNDTALAFFDSKLNESNKSLSIFGRTNYRVRNILRKIRRKIFKK